VEPRISIVTLGVADIGIARRFYEALGWTVGMDVEETVFFQAGGMLLILWGRDKLAEDSGADDAGGWGGVSLAHNVRTNAEVDLVVEEARAAGAAITREPAPTFYGGYSGIFADPDGHTWEIACNPGLPLAQDGSIGLPEARQGPGPAGTLRSPPGEA
jgi:uncharacterized protein